MKLGRRRGSAAARAAQRPPRANGIQPGGHHRPVVRIYSASMLRESGITMRGPRRPHRRSLPQVDPPIVNLTTRQVASRR